MADKDLLRKYLDAGMALTSMTQARAEAIVKDLVRAGEVQTEQAREAAADLLERSRQNTEKLTATVRKEIRQQISNLGLATRDDIARLERKIAKLDASGAAPRKAAARKAAPRKAAAGKAARKAAPEATDPS
ncbi:MAG: phasin family protein [Acidimicrobiia bacterium]